MSHSEKSILVGMFGIKVDGKSKRVVRSTHGSVVKRKLACIDELGVYDDIVLFLDERPVWLRAA